MHGNFGRDRGESVAIAVVAAAVAGHAFAGVARARAQVVMFQHSKIIDLKCRHTVKANGTRRRTKMHFNRKEFIILFALLAIIYCLVSAEIFSCLCRPSLVRRATNETRIVFFAIDAFRNECVPQE